jgi:hypothetical protein
MNASLVRAACAATSANPPATSARLCRRSSASGAFFSPLPPACAVGSGRRPIPFFRSRATRSAFASRTFRSLPLGRGVRRRSSTSAITSFRSAGTTVESSDPRRLDISCIDVVVPRAGRTRALTKAETLADLSLLVTGLLPSNQGPVASLSLGTSSVAALRALSRVRRDNSIATPTSMLACTSRRRARGE